MKLSVIALDYDGTITRDDRLDASMMEAIADARGRGVAVMLVTGRRLDDLRRVAGKLHFVDGVVAENGALVHFPDGGLTTILAPPIPPVFVDRLQKKGVLFQSGQCLIDAHPSAAPRILDAIRELELPLVLLFNYGRVMVTSQGISKATGLRAALETLRKSPRNAVAVGDAETDHELLRLAEVGATVEWSSLSLCAAGWLCSDEDQRGMTTRTRGTAAVQRESEGGAMYETNNDLSETTRRSVIEILNEHLADAIDLQLQAKQAHWNIKGPNFVGLHQLFDQVAAQAREYADEIAERGVALGGVARGTLQAVLRQTQLREYPLEAGEWRFHVQAMRDALATFGRGVRKAIDDATALNDADTADLFTEVSRGVDKSLWMVEAHLQDTSAEAKQVEEPSASREVSRS